VKEGSVGSARVSAERQQLAFERQFVPDLWRNWFDWLNESNLASLFGRVFLLLAGLYLNKRIGIRFPAFWICIPISLAAALSAARYIEAEKPVVRLWQLVGSLSAIYALIHYPLMPMRSDDAIGAALYGSVLCVWLASLGAGVICIKIPSLSILPPSFLLWSEGVAGAITGLPQTAFIDVLPLPEVSICIAIGLLINRIPLGLCNGVVDEHDDTKECELSILLRREFARLVCLFAISIHLANYFWAFYAKATLPGPPLAWLWENNPAYIFLAALNNGHILFLADQKLVEWSFAVLDRLHVVSNLGILFAQGAALIAFFLPNRLLFIFLLVFDSMQTANIFVLVAN
jgi:hypothetical protein